MLTPLLLGAALPRLDELGVQVVTGVDVTDVDAIESKMIPALGGKPVDILINNAVCFARSGA